MKIYLTLVGLLYLGLAVWCTVSPAAVSDRVGLDLKGDSGRSEFLTLYGGLEFGLAVLFLAPLFLSSATVYSFLGCVSMHACLVAFRSASLLMFKDVSAATMKIAVGEWVILLTGVVCWYLYSEEIYRTI